MNNQTSHEATADTQGIGSPLCFPRPLIPPRNNALGAAAVLSLPCLAFSPRRLPYGEPAMRLASASAGRFVKDAGSGYLCHT